MLRDRSKIYLDKCHQMLNKRLYVGEPRQLHYWPTSEEMDEMEFRREIQELQSKFQKLGYAIDLFEIIKSTDENNGQNY